MAFHKFTLGGSHIKGFRVGPDGSVEDFDGTLRNFYKDLVRASIAARRKYKDQTITVTECKADKHRYQVDVDSLLEIAEQID